MPPKDEQRLADTLACDQSDGEEIKRLSTNAT